MKAKQWLFENGHIAKVGKGRISAANHDLLKAECLAGRVFSDYSVESKTVEGKATVQRTAAPSAVKSVVEPATPTWPNGTTASAIVDGKKVKIGMASACMDCGYSLQWCYCHMRPTPCKPRVVATNGNGYVRVDLEVPSSFK